MRLTRKYFEKGESGPTVNVEIHIDVETIAARLAKLAILSPEHKSSILAGACRATIIKPHYKEKG